MPVSPPTYYGALPGPRDPKTRRMPSPTTGAGRAAVVLGTDLAFLAPARLERAYREERAASMSSVAPPWDHLMGEWAAAT